MSESVHLRNAKALDSRNKQLSAEIDELKDRVRHLGNQTAMLATSIQSLEQRLAILFAARGAGPTER